MATTTPGIDPKTGLPYAVPQIQPNVLQGLPTFAPTVQKAITQPTFAQNNATFGAVQSGAEAVQKALAQPANTMANQAKNLALNEATRTQATANQQLQDTLGKAGATGNIRGLKVQAQNQAQNAANRADIGGRAEIEGMKMQNDVTQNAIQSALGFGQLGVTEQQNKAGVALGGMGIEADIAKTAMGEAGATQRTEAQISSSEKIAMAGIGMDEKRLSESARQFGISTDQAAQQFKETMGLSYEQLSQQQKQFLATLGLDQAKFEESKNQFTQSIGVEQQKIASQEKIAGLNISSAEKIAFAQIGMDGQKLEETARQFNISTEQAADQFTKTMQYNYNELSQNDRQFLDSLGLDQAKFEESKRQFDANNTLGYAQLEQQQKEAFGYTDPATGQYVPGKFNLEQQGINIQAAQQYGYTDPATGTHIMGALELGAREIESREGIAADQIAQQQKEAFGYTDPQTGEYVPGKFNLEQQGINLQDAQLRGYTDPTTGEHVMGELEVAGARLGLEGETLDLQRAELLGVDAEGNAIPGVKGKLQILTEELAISQQNANTQEAATKWQQVFQYASVLEPAQAASMIKGAADSLGMAVPPLVTAEEANTYRTRAGGDPAKAAELAYADGKVYLGLDGVTTPPIGSAQSNPIQVAAADTPLSPNGRNMAESYPGYWDGATSTWKPLTDNQYVTFGTNMKGAGGTMSPGTYQVKTVTTVGPDGGRGSLTVYVSGDKMYLAKSNEAWKAGFEVTAQLKADGVQVLM